MVNVFKPFANVNKNRNKNNLTSDTSSLSFIKWLFLWLFRKYLRVGEAVWFIFQFINPTFYESRRHQNVILFMNICDKAIIICMLVLILKIYNTTVNLSRMEAQAHKRTQELLYSRVIIEGARRVTSVDIIAQAWILNYKTMSLTEMSFEWKATISSKNAVYVCNSIRTRENV